MYSGYKVWMVTCEILIKKKGGLAGLLFPKLFFEVDGREGFKMLHDSPGVFLGDLHIVSGA